MARPLKVFISQPMAGREGKDIEDERERIMLLCEKKLGKVREIASYSPLRKERKPLKELGRSIQLMSGADVVVFASGWSYARGCKVERMCAENYGMEVLDMKDIEEAEHDSDKQ